MVEFFPPQIPSFRPLKLIGASDKTHMIRKRVLINLIIFELVLAYRKHCMLGVSLKRPLARTVDLLINFPKTVQFL